MTDMRVLIIIPAFNEEQSIVNMVDELRRICPACDYIVINDCSKDDTLRLCREHGYPVISLPVNLGIGGAMQTGFKYAETCGYDAVIQMDGDGQHDPAYVAQLMAPLITGEADMVIGSRFLEQKSFRSTALRRTGIGILRAVIRLRTGRFITDPTSGFRAMNKRAYSMFARHYAQDYPEPESVVAALVCGMRLNEIPVGMRARSGGVSSINPLRSVYYMLKVTLAVLLQGKYS